MNKAFHVTYFGKIQTKWLYKTPESCHGLKKGTLAFVLPMFIPKHTFTSVRSL